MFVPTSISNDFMVLLPVHVIRGFFLFLCTFLHRYLLGYIELFDYKKLFDYLELLNSNNSQYVIYISKLAFSLIYIKVSLRE